MKTKMTVLALTLLFAAICPGRALADKPLNTIQNQVTAVIDVLRDPAAQGEAFMQAKKDRVWSIAERMFDFTVVSKMTLGKDWNKLDAQQQKQFTELFSKVLANVYMDRVLAYSDERVAFDGEKMLSESKAQVDTRIVTKAGDIPMSYRLYDSGEGWRVYDVVIEGISMVKNYRGQFKEILSAKTPQDLLDVLRRKLETA